MQSVLKKLRPTDRKSALAILGLSLVAMAVLFIVLGALARVCMFFFRIGYSVF